MAWIDCAVRSTLYLNCLQALTVGYGTIGTIHYAQTQPKDRIGRVVCRTFATSLASIMLRALPQAAFQGTVISAALPWAPVAFTIVAVATAYFAPDKTHVPLKAIEITTVALAALAAFAAPSAMTLGTLATIIAVGLQNQEIPLLSQISKTAGSVIGTIGAIWAIKETICSITMKYALYGLVLAGCSLHIALRRANRKDNRAQPLELPADLQTHFKELYINKFRECFDHTFLYSVVPDYRQRSGTQGTNISHLLQVIGYKWFSMFPDDNHKEILRSILQHPEQPCADPKFASFREEWVYRTWTHSATDAPSLTRGLCGLLSSETSIENLLKRVHQKTIHQILQDSPEQLQKYINRHQRTLQATYRLPPGTITMTQDKWNKLQFQWSVTRHLDAYAQDRTLFAGS